MDANKVFWYWIGRSFTCKGEEYSTYPRGMDWIFGDEPPNLDKRREDSRVISAFSPSCRSLFFSLIPVSIDALSSTFSSILSVVLKKMTQNSHSSPSILGQPIWTSPKKFVKTLNYNDPAGEIIYKWHRAIVKNRRYGKKQFHREGQSDGLRRDSIGRFRN